LESGYSTGRRWVGLAFGLGKGVVLGCRGWPGRDQRSFGGFAR
jgi:hypothetical protein